VIRIQAKSYHLMLVILLSLGLSGKASSESAHPIHPRTPSISRQPRSPRPSPSSADGGGDEDDFTESNAGLIIGGLIMISVIGGIGFYVYLRRKWEEAANPEYTRAILGDDAYEFTELDTF
jgi:hypothetical protein